MIVSQARLHVSALRCGGEGTLTGMEGHEFRILKQGDRALPGLSRSPAGSAAGASARSTTRRATAEGGCLKVPPRESAVNWRESRTAST